MKRRLGILMLGLVGLLCMGGCHNGCYSWGISYGLGPAFFGYSDCGPSQCSVPRDHCR